MNAVKPAVLVYAGSWSQSASLILYVTPFHEYTLFVYPGTQVNYGFIAKFNDHSLKNSFTAAVIFQSNNSVN